MEEPEAATSKQLAGEGVPQGERHQPGPSRALPGPQHKTDESLTKPEAQQQVCSFYLRTASCAYGSRCRFLHPQNIPPPTLNSRGLPLRPAEPSCAHYIKKGWCAFGMTCKFNHPELIAHPVGSGLALTAATGQPASMLITSTPGSGTILQTVPGQAGQQVIYTTTAPQAAQGFSTGLTTASVLQAPGTATLQPGTTTVYYVPTSQGNFVPSLVQQPSYQITQAPAGTSFTVVGQAPGNSGLQTLYTQPSSQLPLYASSGTGAQLPTTVYTQLGSPGTQLQMPQGLTADGAQLLQPVVTMREPMGQQAALRQQAGLQVRSGMSQQDMQGGGRSRPGMQLGGLHSPRDLTGTTMAYLPELEGIQELGQQRPAYIQQLPALPPMAGGFVQQPHSQQGPMTMVLGASADHLDLGLPGGGSPASGTGLPSSMLTPGAAAGLMGAAGLGGAATTRSQEMLLPWNSQAGTRISAGADQQRLAGGTTNLVHAMQSLRLSQQQQQQ